jgi:hypothetical protein
MCTHIQVFNRVDKGYGLLTKFTVEDEEVAWVSIVFNFIKSAVHQPCTESMPEWSSPQLQGDFMARKILISSAKNTPRVVNSIEQVINESIGKQRPHDRSLWNAREHNKM